MEKEIPFKRIGDETGPLYSFRPDITSKEDYLGKGQYGLVFKGFALGRNNEQVAIKVIPL